MKSICIGAATACSLLATTFATRADPVDMSTITCGQLLKMSESEVSFMLTWVMGYSAGVDEETSMDPEILGKHVDATVKYCKENEEMSVLNAADESVPG